MQLRSSTFYVVPHYNEEKLTPIDTLLKEIWEIDPSFYIVYSCKTGKTALINAENVTFESHSIALAIAMAWNYTQRKYEICCT